MIPSEARHSFDFHPTTRVVCGPASLERLGELADELDCRRALIVADAGIVAAGHVDKAVTSLRNASIDAVIFADVRENPTTEHVDACVAHAKQNEPIQTLIAIGGGSVMDCAKGANFLLTNGGEMQDYWGIGKAKKSMLPSIGIPTTAGTGSEAQSFALIAQAGTHRKMACSDIKARFRTVILDPSLLSSVPKDVASVTGIDAISHAIESYVSTKRNPVSQMFAREGLRLLVKNYESVLEDPENIRSWGEMQIGAYYAGMAIENSMLGAAHACANPLTANYGVRHGVAIGVMLPHVIRYNASAVNGGYSELLRVAGEEVAADAPSARALAEKIQALRENARLPARLSELDVSRKELARLANEASQQWTRNFNPRPVESGDLLRIYENAF